VASGQYAGGYGSPDETWAGPRQPGAGCSRHGAKQPTWPWYDNVPPVFWLLQRDVDQGRRELNYSEFDRPQREARDSAESVKNGSMPPSFYTWLHSDATLSPAERDAFIRGLQTTFGGAGAR
jgi:hypothetical protein